MSMSKRLEIDSLLNQEKQLECADNFARSFANVVRFHSNTRVIGFNLILSFLIVIFYFKIATLRIISD